MQRLSCTSENPIVKTTQGKLRGYCWNGIYRFSGIRYGRAKRWERPQPETSWEGVRNALGYGYVAPSGNGNWLPDGEEQLRCERRFWPADEDCLFLNVWTKHLSPTSCRPVLFFIHGGGFFAGSSLDLACYDGADLAEFGDAVVVTLNHRLNILGYFDMTSLGEGFEKANNLGQWDLILALRWVRENIRAFGGDPENVTLFGQSGGGQKICTLLQMPAADGLYHRAVVMSGVFPERPKYDSKTAHAELAHRLVRKLCPDEPCKLKEMPYSALIAAAGSVMREMNEEGIPVGWCPVQDSDWQGEIGSAPVNPYGARVPVLAGSVLGEFAATAPQKEKLGDPEQALRHAFGDKAEAISRAFAKAYPGKSKAEIFALDVFVRPATLYYLSRRCSLTEAPCYSYMFSLTYPMTALSGGFPDGTPAYHGLELAYIFHNAHRFPVGGVDGAGELEDRFAGALVRFAETGNPGWKSFDEKNRVTMFFDTECREMSDADTALLQLVAGGRERV